MDDRLERRARNEALTREVNERIERLNEEGAGWGQDDLFEFICECGARAGCEMTIQLTLAEYEHVRDQDDRFAVHPGHETDELEHVVGRNERYVLVDKVPEAEPFVEDDPRGAPSS
ncbi:MAG TPA: hypothetical protein VH306_05290 [Gaiellaceae bacterium]|jgi:hypothetical protein